MKTDELKAKAVESAAAADDSRFFNVGKADPVAALKAIAWAIIYLADVLRYKT